MTRHPALAPASFALVAAALLALASPARSQGSSDGAARLPAAEDWASLHAALPADGRKLVDEDEKVYTFAERTSDCPEGKQVLAISLGVLRHRPDAVLSVLRDVRGYPTWVTFNPNYKSARIQGASSFRAGAGSADADTAKREFVYDVRQEGPLTTWVITDTSLPLGQGSSISFEVVAHPTIPDASLVVHRQIALVPAKGRLTKYLTSDDKKGNNHWWKDSSRHARRTHWAIDAAIRHPPGEGRRDAYLEHYQREFGKAPYWAEGAD